MHWRLLSKMDILKAIALTLSVVFVIFYYKDVRHCESTATLSANIQKHTDHIAESKKPLSGNFQKYTDHITASKKPHIIFGILSAESNRELRDAQRSTWISNTLMKVYQIPFQFTYKFLIDSPTPKTLKENEVNHDILFLNVTHHGKAVKFGEKLYVWMKYIHANYPDALLTAKLDDDVFLCVPEMFHKLNSVKSSKLYYGWAHGSGPVIDRSRRVDEMFVVFGKDIIERIIKRQYCNDTKECDSKKQLVDYGIAGISVGTWLSIYDDIDFRPDNGNLIHKAGMYDKNKSDFIRNDFCEHRILYHKSSPEQMRQLHLYNSLSSRMETNLPGSLTGSLFSGNVTRELPPRERIPGQNLAPEAIRESTCEHWAVVTTIFSPSEAVRYVNTRSEWCLVIIADEKTPEKDVYMKTLGNRNTFFLSLYDQDRWYPYLSKLIPRNHFGRKNIGYLFAIQHNANVIWDFDDDNFGVIDLNFIKQHSNYITACADLKAKTLNPYPYFHDKLRLIWPRGLPLEDIKDERTTPAMCNNRAKPQLTVVQSLANIQPDVDAIFRLTHYMPFNFSVASSNQKILVVPKGVYSPFNAQATLWMKPAFDLMALPLSVNARASDIWRAYIAQYVMHERKLQMAFSTPWVFHKRNEHNDMKDFNAELDVYHKSKQLIDFLSSKHSQKFRNITELYEELYRRDYIDAYDIIFVNAWASTFDNITGPQS